MGKVIFEPGYITCAEYTHFYGGKKAGMWLGFTALLRTWEEPTGSGQWPI
uniref:Uncharacterized protein n=1 Tax=Podarcis muralis TaxID=64176 RepID=A0A670JXE5_PODMU